MGGGIPANVSQTPTDLGGGFEDPMDPCTMCQQGQMEIQQAYNDLNQTCNACQTQQNLKQIQSTGCQGCQQTQQVIQNVQNQAGGCSSCGATQNTTFQQMQPQMMPQQSFVTGQITTPMMMASQGLVQPMLTPLTGTGQQMLTTVIQQPGMMPGQLPIAIERGATTQGLVPTNQRFVSGMLTQPMMTMQPMITSMISPTPMPMQPVVTGMISPPPQPMQPVVMGMIPAPQPMPVQQPMPVYIPPAPPPTPVMQPVMQPAPVIQTPQYTPAQVSALEQYAANLTPQGSFSYSPTTGQGAGFIGTSTPGGGKAGPGGGTQYVTDESGRIVGVRFAGTGMNTSLTGPGGVGVGPGFGAGAFDIHRPDLHAGGGWHNTLPMGALENVFNLY